MHLASLGHPADIGLQFSNACCHLQQVRVEEEGFISAVSSLSFIFLSPLFLSFIASSIFLSLFSLSLGDNTK